MTLWMRRRFAVAALWFLPTQLIGGLWFVLHAQPATVIEQKLTDDVASIGDRVKRLEELHLEARVAVLDTLSDRSYRIELLVIGLFLTTAGNLCLQAWMHRGGQSRRRRGEDVDDELGT